MVLYGESLRHEDGVAHQVVHAEADELLAGVLGHEGDLIGAHRGDVGVTADEPRGLVPGRRVDDLEVVPLFPLRHDPRVLHEVPHGVGGEDEAHHGRLASGGAGAGGTAATATAAAAARGHRRDAAGEAEGRRREPGLRQEALRVSWSPLLRRRCGSAVGLRLLVLLSHWTLLPVSMVPHGSLDASDWSGALSRSRRGGAGTASARAEWTPDRRPRGDRPFELVFTLAALPDSLGDLLVPVVLARPGSRTSPYALGLGAGDEPVSAGGTASGGASAGDAIV